MIQIGNDIPAIFHIGLTNETTMPIATIHIGHEGEALLIWQAISSCFGSGMWKEEQPWKDEDAWKDD